MDLEINYEATVAKTNFFDSYQKKKDELEQLMSEWELVQEEIDLLS